MSEIVYDVTRLTSRFLNVTPNGIDRVDMAFAHNFLRDHDGEASAAVFVPRLGHFGLARQGAVELLALLDRHFGERGDPASGSSLHRIEAWLQGGGAGSGNRPQRIRRARSAIDGAALSWAIRHASMLGRPARRALSRGACYINVSQYPLAREGALDWLGARRDVKPVFFVHDMLPLETPEYFRTRELARHQTRLRNVARFAAGVVVSTHAVKDALQRHLRGDGRGDLPILVAPPPVSPLFRADGPADDALRQTPYFVQCGTLEPRKNHLMTLHVWRELIARHGQDAPKLVIVGARGWENENIVDLLERCAALRGHVLEVSGLRTPSLVRLMRSARALLMPSFAEGYGLPLVEALAVGTPVIASDIAVFREIAGRFFTAVSPIDGEGWLRAIEAIMRAPGSAGQAPRPSSTDSKDYFRSLEAFVAAL
jgi:glycosyltransferase involved in cell wall biosynthesis